MPGINLRKRSQRKKDMLADDTKHHHDDHACEWSAVASFMSFIYSDEGIDALWTALVSVVGSGYDGFTKLYGGWLIRWF